MDPGLPAAGVTVIRLVSAITPATGVHSSSLQDSVYQPWKPQSPRSLSQDLGPG